MELPNIMTLQGKTPLEAATFDPFSVSVFAVAGSSVCRLSGGQPWTAVADLREVLPDIAREKNPSYICTDGKGSLYVRAGADGDRIAWLQLPSAWRAGSDWEHVPIGGAHAQHAVHITTLQYIAPGQVCGLAYHPTDGPNGSLILAVDSRLYRLPLDQDGGQTAAPVPLAGNDTLDMVDGLGEGASFESIAGITVDGEGAVLVADLHDEADDRDDPFVVAEGAVRPSRSVVRRVRLHNGKVETLGFVDGLYRSPVVLPQGHVTLCGCDSDWVRVLGLGLEPPPLAPPEPEPAAPAPAGPPPRSLQSDMRALLLHPGSSADLLLEVAGERFPVHRSILAARCDFFRALQEAGLSDGSAAKLSFPDADPSAFKLVLEWIYTGEAAIPAALACGVAELADRYVLPELFACAGDTVLEELTPGTVVAALLWAERLGRGGLRAWGEPSLMERLRAWFLEHWREVPWSGFVALRESPALVEDLVRDAVRMQRSAKRQRTCGLGPWR
ncbi:hypothetical protein HYH03_018336 [Edaphochlamys debaryana]|uniref:BTB domain-containing protein n=1 Tax=Edaphochlamys debaryana TaxID=47281 RepID=A0A836BN10_9CHLO|nr:hypothetical protein HYH03_018336 [Edaphochlamys debaryana]|eukprot:KAG2482741.1 hypothetical protein HYH03_018336 [Edaphochlamys debaryana]